MKSGPVSISKLVKILKMNAEEIRPRRPVFQVHQAIVIASIVGATRKSGALLLIYSSTMVKKLQIRPDLPL
jgi:hypothetical protein